MWLDSRTFAQSILRMVPGVWYQSSQETQEERREFHNIKWLIMASLSSHPQSSNKLRYFFFSIFNWFF